MPLSRIRLIGPVALAVVYTLFAFVAVHAEAPPQDACTLPGSGSWREYRSRHFLIDVANGNGDPALLVGTFEELHATVRAALVAEPIDVPGRVRVVVLPSRRDLEQIGGRKESPHFLTNVLDPAVLGASDLGEPALFWVSSLGEPTILLASEDLTDSPQAIAHELAHYLSRYLFPRQPYWFAEGLAQFVEGVARPDSQGRRWAGADPTSGQAGVVKLTPVESLMAGPSTGWFNDPYLTSWVLYRFLWNERSKSLAEYQRRLSDGEAPRDAWRAAFPEWDPDTGSLRRLDNDLARHRAAGRGVRWEVKVGAVDRTFTAVAASTADIHMVLLERRLRNANAVLKRKLRQDAAQEALREDPGHPVATVLLASLDGASALPALRAAAAARAADGRTWYLLAREATDPSEREAALRRATRLWPDGAMAYTMLAIHLASTGRAREALSFANQGLDLAPWSPDAVAALARVALELGKCPEALQLQARAADTAEAGTIGPVQSDAGNLRRLLEDYRSRCAGARGVSTQAQPAGRR